MQPSPVEPRMSPTARRLFDRLRETGDRVVVRPGGRTFAFASTDRTAPATAVRELIKRGHLTAPAYPLFGPDDAGTLTEKGLCHE